MKSKTLAAWLALTGGLAGAHRFYLFGPRDPLGWVLPVPTLLGIAGLLRLRAFGVDDRWAWLLAPWLGFVLAACAFNAIVYGLGSAERWNHRFNPGAPEDHPAGATKGLTVAAVVLSLLLGTTALLSALAFSFVHYFEYTLR